MPPVSTTEQTKRVHRSQASDHSRIWFGAGLIVLFAIAVSVFCKTVGIGYLLDDYLHVEYLNQAAHGDLSGVLTRMYSRWSYATDGLLAYRPGLTLSFWLDYTIWNGQAFGMHLTNILLGALVAVLTALVTVQLSDSLQLRHRYLTGLIAGLLFAVYPLHAEETAWIVDRADILGSIFYLTSILTLFRFLKTNNERAFIISLASFLVSLTAKESMVTLPVVITLLAILVCRNLRWKRVSAYWAVLALFAVWRTIAIGQIIGGYGTAGKITFKRIVRTLFDPSSLSKIFLCTTEEISAPSTLQTLASSAYLVIGSCGLFSAAKDLRLVRLFAFLVLWAVVTILPAFQIWHIYPNLIGSRLFYLGSIPLCILLAYCAVGSSLIKSNRIALWSGLAAVAVLAVIWTQQLQINLIPWTVAGQQMARLTKQVQQIAASEPRGQRALIVNIPQDYKGASMLGRPQFLEDLCKPPFYPTDLSSRICTLQRPISGGHEYLYPELLQQLRAHTSAAYVWDEKDGNLVKMKSAVAASDFNEQKPVADLITQDTLTQASRTKSDIRIVSDCLEVRMGSNPIKVWLSVGQLDPTEASAVELKLAQTVGIVAPSKFKPALIWRDTNGEHSIEPSFVRDNIYYYVPARQKNWALLPKLTEIGFVIPAGDATIQLQTLKLTNNLSPIEPSTSIQILPEHQADLGYQLWLTDANSTSKISFNAKDIPGCSAVRMFITKPWQAFDDVVSSADPRKELLASTETLQTPSTEVRLPAEILKQPGAHQVAVLPVDKFGKPCGIMSEPRSFLIEAATK